MQQQTANCLFSAKGIKMKKISRRSFMGNTSKAALAGTIILATPKNEEQEMKNIFVHHVFFWLKNEGSTDDLAKLLEGLKKLSGVKTIQQFHIGRPASTSRSVIDGSYAVSWFTLFENKADQDSYQTDPIHLKFIEECSSLWSKVIVYDSVDM